MNHYHVNGKKMLFVALSKWGKCIKAEGEDNKKYGKSLEGGRLNDIF